MSIPPVYEQPESLVIPLEIRLDKRLCPEVIARIEYGFNVYSKAYRFAFSRIDHSQENLNQLTKELQNQYGLKSRTANSIARDAKTRHQAGLELARAQAETLRVSILRKKKKKAKLKETVEEKAEKQPPICWMKENCPITADKSAICGVWVRRSRNWKRN